MHAWKTMTITRTICGVLLLLLWISQSVHGAMEIADLDQPVSIAGLWHFKAGDNPNWAAPDLNDRNWEAVDLLTTTPDANLDDDGMAWHRLTVQLDLDSASVQRQLGALAVSIGSINSAYQLFAGGQNLGGVGALPPNPAAVFDKFQIYPIPVSAIGDDGKLVLALRVWRAEGRAENNPYRGPFELGNIGDLRSSAIFQSLVPNVILGFLYLAIGLYHLLIARRNPSMREFFWFGWFAIALSAYSLETSQIKFALDIPYLLHKKIEYFSLYMVPFLLTEVLVRVVGIRLNLAGRAFQYLFLVYALAVAVVPNLQVHYLTLPSFQVLAAIWSLGTAVLMAWLGWRGNRRARVIFVLSFLATLAVINYVISVNSVQSTTYLLHFMFASIILFMAVLMANNYTATLAKLEKSVEEHTADLRNTNRELESALAVRSQFLANMSHELRTPMNAIIGLTHLGLKTELTEQQRGYLMTVEQSAHALGGIVEGIFDFTRLEAGELECVQEPFSVKQLVASLELAYSPQAEARSLSISFDQEPSIPGRLIGDAPRLNQILGHFLSNAIKFTEQGEVRFSARLLELSDAQAMLEFAVSDTGPGLSPEQQEGLFEPFTQVDNANTRAHGGTGLGLVISHALAGLMDGVIEVESEQGSGSTFRLRLPLAVAIEDDSILEPASTEEQDLAPINGAQILLVDDSEINLQVAGELLARARLHVDLARNGQEAVDAVKRKHFDCVLMDIQMPVMDGYTATRTIRSLAGYESLPILAMTANVLPEDRAKATEAGVNDHIPKPIDPQELYSKLLRWIEPGERIPFEPVADNTEVTEVTGEMPEQLPGIALSDGLKRVGGNSRLYMKLLLDMRKNYATAAQSIEALYGAGDGDGASQLAHKLRGIANNLGAIDVGTYAEQLELRLKTGEAVAEALFAELATGLSVLVDSINELEQLLQDNSSSGQVNAEEMKALMAQLAQEMADNNPAAEETVGRLLQGMDESADGYQALAAIRDAIDIFDFPTATQHLAAAQEAIEA
jgi:signal transduction histidine kinase/HPt (histidine-containing phosphotransfer) domain-containing protein/ActR/RegA family two-component response regulator